MGSSIKNALAWVKAKIGRWWQGRYVPPDQNSVVLYLGHYERHWTSEMAHIVADFYLAHWKWIIGTGIAVIGLYVAKN